MGSIKFIVFRIDGNAPLAEGLISITLMAVILGNSKLSQFQKREVRELIHTRLQVKVR